MKAPMMEISQIIRGEKYRTRRNIECRNYIDGVLHGTIIVPKGVVVTIIKFDYFTKMVVVLITGATVALNYEDFRLGYLIKCEESMTHPTVIDTVIMLADKRPLFALTLPCALAVSMSMNVLVILCLLMYFLSR